MQGEIKEMSESIKENIIAHARWVLANQMNSVEDLVQFWALFGPCIYRRPNIENFDPWFQGLEDYFPKVRFKR